MTRSGPCADQSAGLSAAVCTQRRGVAPWPRWCAGRGRPPDVLTRAPSEVSARELASRHAAYESHCLCWPLLQTWCGGSHAGSPGWDVSVSPQRQVRELSWGQASPRSPGALGYCPAPH